MMATVIPKPYPVWCEECNKSVEVRCQRFDSSRDDLVLVAECHGVSVVSRISFAVLHHPLAGGRITWHVLVAPHRTLGRQSVTELRHETRAHVLQLKTTVQERVVELEELADALDAHLASVSR